MKIDPGLEGASLRRPAQQAPKADQVGPSLRPEPIRTADTKPTTASPMGGLVVAGVIVAAMAIGAMWMWGQPTPVPAAGSLTPQAIAPTPQAPPVSVVAGQREVSQDAMWGIIVTSAVISRTSNDNVISGYGTAIDGVSTTEQIAGCRVVAVQTPGSTWLRTMGGAIGDVITEYAGRPVRNVGDINAIHALFRAKDIVTVKVLRGGQVITLTGAIGSVQVVGALP